MKLRVRLALVLAGTLCGCAGAQPAGPPKDLPAVPAGIAVAGRAPAPGPSCRESIEPERRVFEPPRHAGMCTE